MRVALDIFLPKATTGGERVPVVFHQTRYHRSMRVRWPARWALGSDLDRPDVGVDPVHVRA